MLAWGFSLGNQIASNKGKLGEYKFGSDFIKTKRSFSKMLEFNLYGKQTRSKSDSAW